MPLTVGVDIGGTKIAAGVVDEQGAMVESTRHESAPDDAGHTAQIVEAMVTDLVRAFPVATVGLAAAGFVDAARSKVLFAPNVAWRSEPLRERIERACGVPVVVENDANAAAWGEARFGAGRGKSNLVMLTMGTGLGGGIVLRKALYRGQFGIASEVGHLNYTPGGRRCGCGNRGCWERYASGTALAREAHEIASVSRAYFRRLLDLAGGRSNDITGPMVTQAATEGDPAALECLRIVATALGNGMADIAALLDPGTFIIGGGLSDAGELLRQPAETAFRDQLTGRGHRPVATVQLAQLGQHAGVIGVADLARQSDAS